jgi:hypothetical protein
VFHGSGSLGKADAITSLLGQAPDTVSEFVSPDEKPNSSKVGEMAQNV